MELQVFRMDQNLHIHSQTGRLYMREVTAAPIQR